MIFVTVGTHEQQFDRLIKGIDELKQRGIINEDVIMQTGFCTYEPRFCSWKNLFPYQDMCEYVRNARIVITHGGPSSFIMPLQIGKIPIVVPRQEKFGEHVNNHQVEFANAVAERNKNILVVNDLDELENIIVNYDACISQMNSSIQSNNKNFNEKFEQIVNDMFKK